MMGCFSIADFWLIVVIPRFIIFAYGAAKGNQGSLMQGIRPKPGRGNI
jgi:hypothetical protein